MQVGGSALHRAARGVVAEARRRMADRYGVAPDEVGYGSGRLSVRDEEIYLGTW
jgi:hypothetical protein